MIGVVFALLHAMVWMILWFVRTLAIVDGQELKIEAGGEKDETD